MLAIFTILFASLIGACDQSTPASQVKLPPPTFGSGIIHGVVTLAGPKPKLEKKSLTTDDFKAGMATIAAQAQACYKGTQGTASVKLTIGPTGSVTKVTVGGAFAGKPEATCVANAVKAAKFPAWDGGPQSFTYSYMLAD